MEEDFDIAGQDPQVDRGEPIKRKEEKDIEKDNLDLSDQIMKTGNKQKDYEEKVIDLITRIVDGDAYINDLIDYILKNRRTFKKKKSK